MAFMRWTEAMSVGVPELDDDHKVLIRIINQLAEEGSNGTRERVVREALEDLRSYAEFHFAREEAVMAACGFPALESHIDEHQDFFKDVQQAARRFTESPAAVAEQMHDELLDYLKSWLNHHILIIDMSYRPFAEGKAEARRAAQAHVPAASMRDLR